MTHHTITSIAGPARRAVIGLMVLGLLLSGCSAGPAAEAPITTATPAPTADPRTEAAAIAVTFPTEAEWLENYERGSLCTAAVPGPTNCGTDVGVPGTNSAGSNLRDGVSAVTARLVALSVIEWDSPDAAQASRDGAEAESMKYAGEFDLPMDVEANTTGERGSGALDEFDRDGWSGFELSRLSEMTGQDGVAVNPMRENVLIVLTKGQFEFRLRLELASAEPGVADAEVNGWLDRSFGPAKTG